MKIMLAVDGSPCSARALDHAAHVLPLERYELVVAAVATASSSKDVALALDAARKALGAAGERATYTLREGEPAERLLEIAHDERPDLIVMGSHGRGAAGRLVMGSVSEAVLHRWNGAVMIVRDAGPRKPNGKPFTTVGDVMTPTVTTCSSDLPYGFAAGLMARHDVGALPVMERGRPVGIVTDRDLVVRGLAQNLDPTRVSLGHLCSRDLVTAPPELPLVDAVHLMEDRKVRRLLIIEQERLVGVVSLGDLAACSPARAEEVLVAISRSPRTTAHLRGWTD